MTNLVKTTLEKVFGDKLPKDTTSFHTVGMTAVFVVGNNTYIEVPFDDEQKEVLKARGILGTFGWSLD